MKKALSFVTVVIMIFILCSCGCEHKWQKANCKYPKTCIECGETEGKPLSHKWKAATCEAPKTCELCNKTDGKALSHEWKAATCTAPKTCQKCNKTVGEKLPHDFESATCQSPKTCKVCKATEGKKGSHSYKDYVCTVCKKEDSEGKSKDPRYSFSERQYKSSYIDAQGDYHDVMISFGKPMGNGASTHTPNPLNAMNPDSVIVINGKTYYYAGGSAAMNEWSYELTSSEIIIYDAGSIIGKFTLNSDGSLYCTYGNHYAIITGITYY